MKNKQYRFFYHYNKQLKKMTVHFKGKCLIVQDIMCEVPAQTKWNKTQPQLVLQGFCEAVEIMDDIAIIK
jgi:hypothetical protein